MGRTAIMTFRGNQTWDRLSVEGQTLKSLQNGLSVLKTLKETLNHKKALQNEEILATTKNAYNHIVSCTKRYLKDPNDYKLPETSNRETVIAFCEKLKVPIALQFLATKAVLMKTKGVRTIRSMLAEYDVTMEQFVEYISPKETLSSTTIQIKMAEARMIDFRIEAAQDFEFDNQSRHVSILRTIQNQICSALYLQKIITKAYYHLATNFVTAENHAASKKNIEEYAPFKKLFQLLCFVPFDKLEIFLYVGAAKEHFDKFLKETENVDIDRVIAETFPHLDKAALEKLIFAFKESQQLIIDHTRNYYLIEEALAKSCAARKISTEKFRTYKRGVLAVYYESVMEKFEHHQLIKREAITVFKAWDNQIDILDPRPLNQLIYAEITLDEFKQFFVTIEWSDKNSTEEKAAAPAEPKKSKQKKKKKKTAGETPKPVALPKENETLIDSKADSKREEVSSKALATTGTFKQNSSKELEALKKSANFTVAETKETTVPTDILHVARSMQINAMMFDMIKVLDKRLNSNLNNNERNRARLLRNALVHCKGLINEADLAPGANNNFDLLYREVKQFAQALIKHVENPSENQLKACPFYDKCIAHGMVLDQGKQPVTFNDRVHYSQLLNLQWTLYDFPWATLEKELPNVTNEHIYQSALKMLMRKFKEYTYLPLKDQTLSALLSAFHGNDYGNVVEMAMDVHGKIERGF